MSGIIGKLSFDPAEPLAQPSLEGMLGTLAHRSDEGHCVFSAPGVALGWCGPRTAMVHGAHAAAAPAGHQVVAVAEEWAVQAVADSSITNAAYVRTQLRRLGYRFEGFSDAELIEQAYAAWGVRCFERLRGPFACAIWDAAARRLVLARDHMGIRPLYFALLPGHGVVFASEIRALLHDPGVSRQWSPEAIDAYLTFGYVPAPLTAFTRVSKLEAAQVLVMEGRRLRVERYWDLPVAPPAVDAHSRLAALDRKLRGLVSDELAGDAAHGILYSGGIASTSLLAAAPRESAATAITVAIDHDPSELARSGAAANLLGRSRELESPALAIAALAGEFATHFEEPIADPSAVAQFAVCLAARRYTDRALAGHGAATLWGGRARPGLSCLWDDFHRRALYTRGFAWQLRDAHPLQRHLEWSGARSTAPALDRTLYVDAHTLLPDSVIASSERAAGVAGLRLHYPFLDRELVELAAATPESLKRHGRGGMAPLRALLARRLPPAVRPPAEAPRAQWLHHAIAALVPSMLLAPRFDGRGIVSKPALAQLWGEHRAGRRDHAHRLWSLVMLELWFREFIDGDAAEEPLEYAVLKVA